VALNLLYINFLKLEVILNNIENFTLYPFQSHREYTAPSLRRQEDVREVIFVYPDNHVKNINTLCVWNSDLFNINKVTYIVPLKCKRLIFEVTIFVLCPHGCPVIIQNIKGSRFCFLWFI
jgi:hypothetical protein